ncbi:type II secretion system protein GspH [Lysobacter pythonis]|uniref:Type II secretion system protein H n=1 Tax=Solilutibacter pythonis TaxID=2483112 RepID=A0A3M2HVB5_9GAMM|nr:GspH/FimT family pseudopilin [Lysobacter pythonis]RMH90862.1 type II secretion system protein GspH [Lysobacter pythonis]
MPISPANNPPRVALPASGSAGGFTLLEILLVLALVSGAMLMMSAALSRSGEGPRLRAAAAQMANGLRDTRARAMREQRVQRFVVDPRAHRWRAAGRSSRALPERSRVAMTTAAELRTPEGAAIVFFPDGASSGGRIELAQNGQAWRLDVHWLTGQVRTTRVAAR